MNSLYIAANLFKRVLGHKNGWLSYILIPSLILSLIVFFVGKEPSKSVEIAYSNLDKGILGEFIVKELEAKESYTLIKMEPEQLKDSIQSQEVAVGFIIPEQFTDNLMAGKETPVQKFQLSLTEASFTLEMAINQTIGQMERTKRTVSEASPGDELLTTLASVLDQQSKHQVKAVVIDERPYISDSLYLVIGFILFFHMGLITNTLGFVLDDRKQLTMARMYTSPVRSFEIALGNLLGSLGVGLLQLLIVLIITKYVFGFNYGVPFFSLITVLAAFLVAVVGIATAVAGLVRNQTNLGAVNSLIITPTCMIGGCWWPISVMPDFMQKLSNFVPQKWAIDGVTQMAAGESLAGIGLHLGILVLFGLIFLGFGSVILRPTEEALD